MFFGGVTVTVIVGESTRVDSTRVPKRPVGVLAFTVLVLCSVTSTVRSDDWPVGEALTTKGAESSKAARWDERNIVD